MVDLILKTSSHCGGRDGGRITCKVYHQMWLYLRHFTVVSTFIIINIIIIIIIIIIYETESTVQEGFEIFFVYTTKVLIG